MIAGNKISLKAVERKDLEQLRNWRNNINFRKYFREFKEISDYEQEKWFDDKIKKDDKTIMFSIRDLKNNVLIGCCGLVYINWKDRHADLSLYIGKNDLYIDDNGLAEESCKLLLDYAFSDIGLNKVWTEIYEFDQKKYNLFEKIGFSQDGVLRQNYWFEGKWWNSIILSFLNKDYINK
tara:strand:- start:71 stop:607 length:537 start_codon:yes stop_codon:yes gene_type:complete